MQPFATWCERGVIEAKMRHHSSSIRLLEIFALLVCFSKEVSQKFDYLSESVAKGKEAVLLNRISIDKAKRHWPGSSVPDGVVTTEITNEMPGRKPRDS